MQPVVFLQLRQFRSLLPTLVIERRRGDRLPAARGHSRCRSRSLEQLILNLLLNGIEAVDPEQSTCVETLRPVPSMIEGESQIDDTNDFGSTQS